MKIDSHQHFWKFDQTEYRWINDSMGRIRRDFLPTDLGLELAIVGIDGSVAVQARQTLDETAWLLKLAEEHEFVKAVVGWVPLCEADVRRHLDVFASHPLLKGVRHVVHDEPDHRFILRDDFNAGVGALVDYELVFDILIYERHLPEAIEFVDRHPRQVFVLDHLAKPQVKEDRFDPWRGNLARLAERENVYCKISGLATEADWNGWTEPQLAAYLDSALEAFGPQRLMFGSDWPVCLLAVSYRKWYELVVRVCSRLTVGEQERVFGGTAVEAYRL